MPGQSLGWVDSRKLQTRAENNAFSTSHSALVPECKPLAPSSRLDVGLEGVFRGPVAHSHARKIGMDCMDGITVPCSASFDRMASSRYMARDR